MSEVKPSPGEKEAPTGDLVAREPRAPEVVQGDPGQLTEFIALERERIASQDRRTVVMRHAIDASDAADKRQHDYHVEKLRREDEANNRRQKSGIAISWTCSWR